MNMNQISVLRRVPTGALSAFALALLLWLTLAPKPLGDNEIHLFPGADKVVHGLMFGGVAFALCFDYGLRQWKRDIIPARYPRRWLLGVFIFVTLLGGVIELLQESMGMGRGGDWLDFAADALGAALSCWVSPKILR